MSMLPQYYFHRTFLLYLRPFSENIWHNNLSQNYIDECILSEIYLMYILLSYECSFIVIMRSCNVFRSTIADIISYDIFPFPVPLRHSRYFPWSSWRLTTFPAPQQFLFQICWFNYGKWNFFFIFDLNCQQPLSR